jgi:hypothetical protein
LFECRAHLPSCCNSGVILGHDVATAVFHHKAKPPIANLADDNEAGRRNRLPVMAIEDRDVRPRGPINDFPDLIAVGLFAEIRNDSRQMTELFAAEEIKQRESQRQQ